jgi:hypothetical protein
MKPVPDWLVAWTLACVVFAVVFAGILFGFQQLSGETAIADAFLTMIMWGVFTYFGFRIFGWRIDLKNKSNRK